MKNQIFAQNALLPIGWQANVLLSWDDKGCLTEVKTHTEAPVGVEQIEVLIPGMPNLHSHAFQRAFAGLTEYRFAEQDSFWSWRKLMYGFAALITPEQLEKIATWLYIEMLEAGYTSVCEFHYVHLQQDGLPYPEPTALSQSLLRAAKKVGIGMTLLPVCYQTGGFGGQPANEGQKRFLHSTDDMLALWDQLAPLCSAQGAKLGIAPHSLRAMTPENLAILINAIRDRDINAPIHIHIAEQMKEVNDCVAWSGQRPVDWLLDHMRVDEHWCLIHATHMNELEYQRAAETKAVVGICPTTEANLGDGIFDYPLWVKHKGHWGIGTDSHAVVNAAEDLYLLESSQRLHFQQRNVCATPAHPEVATNLYLAAMSGGAQASGRAIGGFSVGQQADFVALDTQHVALAGLPVEKMLSGHVMGSSRTSAIARVWTAGQECVNRTHDLHDQAQADFIATRAELLQQI